MLPSMISQGIRDRKYSPDPDLELVILWLPLKVGEGRSRLRCHARGLIVAFSRRR